MRNIKRYLYSGRRRKRISLARTLFTTLYVAVGLFNVAWGVTTVVWPR